MMHPTTAVSCSLIPTGSVEVLDDVVPAILSYLTLCCHLEW